MDVTKKPRGVVYWTVFYVVKENLPNTSARNRTLAIQSVTLLTEQQQPPWNPAGWSSSEPTDLYSGHIQFETRPGYRLLRLRLFMVFLNRSKRMLELYLQIGQDRLVLNSLSTYRLGSSHSTSAIQIPLLNGWENTSLYILWWCIK
jgi:hypothetical protein